MALRDFLNSDETIKFQSPGPVEYQGGWYDLLVTDKRVVWYRRDGLIFKKDNFICEYLDNVKSIGFKEEGILNRRGTVILSTGAGEKRFSGPLTAMRALMNETQNLIQQPRTQEKVIREIVREPVYVKENLPQKTKVIVKYVKKKSVRKTAAKRRRK